MRELRPCKTGRLLGNICFAGGKLRASGFSCALELCGQEEDLGDDCDLGVPTHVLCFTGLPGLTRVQGLQDI